MKNIKKIIDKLKELKIKVFIFFNNIVEKDVKELIFDIKEYNIIDFTTFILILPFTFIFFILNIISFLIWILFYFGIFFLYFFKIKFIKKYKKNTKIIKYKKRFKFLKNFYIIIIEKVFLTFPKKKAFLVFYIILKKIFVNDTLGMEIEFIIKWFKALSNRYVISIIIGLPFIVLYCNNRVVKNIKQLKDYNYEDKEAFVTTIILNLYSELTPNYTKIVENLKIIIKKKSVNFNSLKELLKSLKFKKEFSEDFKIIKKNSKYGLVKNIIKNNKTTKEHPTLIIETKKDCNKIIYINETTKNELKIKRFNEKIQEYIDEQIKTYNKHFKSINHKKIVFFTPPIETEKNKLIIIKPKNKDIIENIKEEKSNNISASFITNLKSNIIKTKEINNENNLIKNETEKALIEWVKKNKNNLNNEMFKTLLRINYFWEENEVVIKNMNLQNKIELSKIIGLDLEDFENLKEVNFKTFVSFINKKN